LCTKVRVVDETRAKTLSQWRHQWLVVSIVAAVASTLAKETGIVTFALCLICDSDVFRLLQPRRYLRFCSLLSFSVYRRFCLNLSTLSWAHVFIVFQSSVEQFTTWSTVDYTSVMSIIHSRLRCKLLNFMTITVSTMPECDHGWLKNSRPNGER